MLGSAGSVKNDLKKKTENNKGVLLWRTVLLKQISKAALSFTQGAGEDCRNGHGVQIRSAGQENDGQRTDCSLSENQNGCQA